MAVFNVIWDREAVPQEFKDALLVHLFKHKGNRHICNNHHGISLLATAGKIVAKIIINRLTATVTVEVVPKSQCGFHTSRGTTNILFSTRQDNKTQDEQNMELFMVFVDLTKTSDSVSREGLRKILAKAGCPPRLVNIIRSFHDGIP